MGWYFTFFFISGFCSVLYELVWLRLAMAEFGVTSAMVAIVLSVFMAGLGLGSWAGGEFVNRLGEKIRLPTLRVYAAIELLIGISAIAVPYELGLGHRILQGLGSASSAAYYVVSGIAVAVTLIPWCALMGATIPVAMAAIGHAIPAESARSFSFLYTANVAGAVAGTVIPLLLIESLGFRGTLRVGTAFNFLIALLAFVISTKTAEKRTVTAPQSEVSLVANQVGGTAGTFLLLLLFTTGLSSMGMEVVWVRQFTPYLGTMVYAFATTLAVYLLATYVGARAYRSVKARLDHENPLLWALLGFFALLPLLTASPSIVLSKGTRLLLGIAPFTGMLGFITPMLVDRWSRGSPIKAGKAYAVNVLGCIVGPLLAGFALLPWTSERWAIVLLSLPWLILGVRPMFAPRTRFSVSTRVAAYGLVPICLGLLLAGRGYEYRFGQSGRVLRDSTATVIATGSGMKKRLLVNGYGMTTLTPVTKMMAHLPLAFLDHPPQEALVVCFGMGTTFRSMRSWGIPVTVVELVPSVPRLFGYFHSDGPEILKNPLSNVVTDDGRRYLERTSKRFDVITIDPPPPIEAAGSSMLYSIEFYATARKRMRPGGILQQFMPYGDAQDFTAIASAIQRSFPYVRVFRWSENWGFHFLASDRPLPDRSARDLAAQLPPSAAADFVEWGPRSNPEGQFEGLLKQEVQVKFLIAKDPATPALMDDRPINEYYALRRFVR